MRSTLLTIALAVLSVRVAAQDTIQHRRAWRLSVALTDQITREPRFAREYQSGTGLGLGLQYTRERPGAASQASLAYARAALGDDAVSDASQQFIDLRYAHLRDVGAVSGLRLGAYVDVGILFAQRRGLWSDNNEVNYTAWTGLGIAASFERNVGFAGERLRSGLAFPLLAYVIRPSYGSTFPDAYVEPGTFTFTQEGVAGAGLRSGHVAPLGRFLLLDARVAIAMLDGNSPWGLDFEVRVRLLGAGKQQRMSTVAPSLGLTLSR